MTKQQKQDWLTALRSGDYVQGTGCMFNGENHCCLGVLAELHGIKRSELNNDETYTLCSNIIAPDYNTSDGDTTPVLEEIYCVNDNSEWDSVHNKRIFPKGYTNVIPFIEALETED